MRWFQRIQDEFAPLAMPFAGKPITYVEIGVWEGLAAKWVCENVLTHQDSLGIGIDPYMSDERYDDEAVAAAKSTAVERLREHHNWTWRFERSQIALARAVASGFPKSVDLAYIDGSHFAHDALIDFCLLWEMLSVGAVVIMDDWGIGMRKHFRHVPEACEAVKIAFGDMVKVVHEGPKQFAVRVETKDPPKDPKYEAKRQNKIKE